MAKESFLSHFLQTVLHYLQLRREIINADTGFFKICPHTFICT